MSAVLPHSPLTLRQRWAMTCHYWTPAGIGSWTRAQRMILLFLAAQLLDICTTVVALSVGGREAGLDGPQITAHGAAGYFLKWGVAYMICMRVADAERYGKMSARGAYVFMLVATLIASFGPVVNAFQLARWLLT